MNEPRDDVLLSQLVDGELDGDEANALLLEIVDDEPRRERLRELLRMRSLLAAWRRQGFTSALPPAARRSLQPTRVGARTRELALAAAVGGLLVAGGFMMSHLPAPLETAQPDVFVLSDTQLTQTAHAFALHEAVAGPLSWYASDERDIQLASAPADASVPPIAVFVHVRPEGDSENEREYVVVCREGELAAARFPGGFTDAANLHVRLTPRVDDGRIVITYAITLGNRRDERSSWSSLVGRRAILRQRTFIGQLEIDGRLYEVGVSAGVLPSIGEV